MRQSSKVRVHAPIMEFAKSRSSSRHAVRPKSHRKRRFDRAPTTSDLPREADIVSVGRHVGSVPTIGIRGEPRGPIPPTPREVALTRFDQGPCWPGRLGSLAALAGVCARLGADVDRYTFSVRDSHPLLLASLPAHSKNRHNRRHSRAPKRRAVHPPTQNKQLMSQGRVLCLKPQLRLEQRFRKDRRNRIEQS